LDELRRNAKIAWSGTVTAIQPRIRLTRSFDEQSHTYLGYMLRIDGTVRGESADFRVGIGSGPHAKHQLRIGDQVEGLGHRVTDPRFETADIYKVSKLKLMRRGEELATTAQSRDYDSGTTASKSALPTTHIGASSGIHELEQ
jgi:hypothetical protein